MRSLLGLLVFSCHIMPMARVFTCQLLLAAQGAKSLGHWIRKTLELQTDLMIWRELLLKYNTLTCYKVADASNHALQLFTDTAGSQGFGAIFGKEWCVCPWPQCLVDTSS